MSKPPSNHELAQRTARIEEQVNHVAETVDRIENSLDDDLADVAEDVEEVEKQIEGLQPEHTRMWLVYQAAKWSIAGGSGGGILVWVTTRLI